MGAEGRYWTQLSHRPVKNDGEKWSRKKYFLNSSCPFRVADAQCIKICPEGLNWPGWLAGTISEGARGISK